MQMKRSKRLMSFILSMVLIVAMALCTAGCNDSKSNDVANGGSTSAKVDENNSPDVLTEESAETSAEISTEASIEMSTESGDVIVLGEGKTEFNFSVVDKDGNDTRYVIRTDKEIVGDALLELDMIDGEDGPYGLYVKTVNGITVDYNKDGKYWSFYINGEYAMSGVDSTPVTDGAEYAFKVEK